jgi:hypothetical protein
MNASSFFLFSLLCAPLIAQLSVPRIGTVRYPDGSLHSVQGLPANLIVAEAPFDYAEAASFSDSGGLIFQKGVIRLLSSGLSTLAEYPVTEKPVLAMDGDLTSALAWLPVSHTIIHWNGSNFDAFGLAEFDIEGTVTDLQCSGSKQARLIVQHADDSVSGVTVSLRTGNLVSSEPLPGARGYTYGQGFFLIYSGEKELLVDNLRGYRRNVALPANDFVIERMSNTWLHLYSPGLRQNWALHLTQADLQLSLLPGPPEQHGKSAVAVNATQGVK